MRFCSVDFVETEISSGAGNAFFVIALRHFPGKNRVLGDHRCWVHVVKTTKILASNLEKHQFCARASPGKNRAKIGICYTALGSLAPFLGISRTPI